MSVPTAIDTSAESGYRRKFTEFLNRDTNEAKYSTLIASVMKDLHTRVIVNVNDLRTFDRELADLLLNEPIKYLPIFERTIRDIIIEIDPDYYHKVARKHKVTHGSDQNERVFKVSVGLTGHFGTHTVNPRTLHAEHLSHMVCVEGIVTRCSLVRPKVIRSVHFSPKTGVFQTREYRDATDLGGTPTGTVYPTKDDEGNPLETEFGLSTYKDTQTVTIQELPETSPLGQLPRSIDILLEGDLVDLVRPGDRVSAVGIYRSLVGASGGTGGAGGVSTGMFRTALLCNCLARLNRGVLSAAPSTVPAAAAASSGTIGSPSAGSSSNSASESTVSSGTLGGLVLTPTDLSNIRSMVHQYDDRLFYLLSRSLAPSIYGHKYIKQALVLLLLGGLEHNLQNGTHIRGDINLLLVGDPSTAKSQLLRCVMQLAQVSVSTTGRGSSGVGLTAAVTTDPETGERRLEAGAMVLADRGVVCIDEFDKMSDADRVAIHEVMEQQTVTIAKAGIQASLNARCSVVAAANPVYGRFDDSLPLVRNVSLPDSLLSRFDVVFIVRDIVSKEGDKRLAEHVLRMHRYQRPGQEGKPIPLNANARDLLDEDDKTSDGDGTSIVFQKYNPILHVAISNDHELPISSSKKSRSVEILTTEFIQKFIYHAKSISPILTDSARECIVMQYDSFRQNTIGRSTVVTARSLETLIRLSTAVARSRLSSLVQRKDVLKAVIIMQYALYGDVPKRDSVANSNNANTSNVAGVEASEPIIEGLVTPTKPSRQPKAPKSASDGDGLGDSSEPLESKQQDSVTQTGSKRSRIEEDHHDDEDAVGNREVEQESNVVSILPEPNGKYGITNASPEYIYMVQVIGKYFREKRKDVVDVMVELLPYLRKVIAPEMQHIIDDLQLLSNIIFTLHNDDKIMFIDGFIHNIV